MKYSSKLSSTLLLCAVVAVGLVVFANAHTSVNTADTSVNTTGQKVNITYTTALRCRYNVTWCYRLTYCHMTESNQYKHVILSHEYLCSENRTTAIQFDIGKHWDRHNDDGVLRMKALVIHNCTSGGEVFAILRRVPNIDLSSSFQNFEYFIDLTNSDMPSGTSSLDLNYATKPHAEVPKILY